MSFALAFLSLLPPFAIGFLIVSLLWRRDRSILTDLPLKCCLAVGFGFGTSSCLVFVWMLIVGRLSRGVFVCELLLLLSLCILLMRRNRTGVSTTTAREQEPLVSLVSKPIILRLAALAVLVSAIVRFVFFSLQDPNGQFDAYAIWNLHARFLFRGGDSWTHYIYMTWSHPDYPLLIPASIARSWDFIGRETSLVPIAIAMLFTFASIGIVVFSIARLRGERQGLLAGLILLGTPFLIAHGASQYADVPLSFFFVATVALLFLHAESPSQISLLILAGIAAAFAGWTKNEGLVFLLLLLALHFCVTSSLNGRKEWRRQAAALFTGAAPVIVILVFYKLRLAGANDVIAAQGLDATLSRVLSIARFHTVLREFGRGLFNFGGWASVVSAPMLMCFYFLLVGASVEKRKVPAAGIAMLLGFFMILGYFAIYMLSPYGLEWHLESSLSRLFLQIWPFAVLSYFSIVRSPEQASFAEAIKTTVPASD